MDMNQIYNFSVNLGEKFLFCWKKTPINQNHGLILLIIYRKIWTPITCKEFFSNNLDTFKAVDCDYKRQSSGLIKMFKKTTCDYENFSAVRPTSDEWRITDSGQLWVTCHVVLDEDYKCKSNYCSSTITTVWIYINKVSSGSIQQYIFKTAFSIISSCSSMWKQI